MSSDERSPSTVSHRTWNCSDFAFAAAVFMSATARISMPRNFGAIERYAEEMLPHPMMPSPKAPKINSIVRIGREFSVSHARRPVPAADLDSDSGR